MCAAGASSGCSLPVRFLDAFQVYCLDEGHSGLWSLEVLLQGTTVLYASGRLFGQSAPGALYAKRTVPGCVSGLLLLHVAACMYR